MKNKEIERILKYLKNNTYIPDEAKRKYKILHRDEVNLLLSYIEQLEKELKEEQEDNYKQSQLLVEKQQKIEQLEKEKEKITKSRDFHLRFNKSLMNRVDEYKKENKQLENNIDKAIEYLKEKADYPISYYHCIREAIDILKGDSDE